MVRISKRNLKRKSPKRKSRVIKNRYQKSMKKRKSLKPRKMNEYFKAMIHAKKNNLPYFKYKEKTYVGAKHPNLGMIYRSK